jgi:hypothetical protein
MKKLGGIVRNPVWAAKRIREKYFIVPAYGKKHIKSFKQLIDDLEYEFDDFINISDELLQFSELNNYVNQKFKETKIFCSYPPERYSWTVLLYFLIRKTKPERIVETGCWYGNSTVSILAALKMNMKGDLFTIDLPAYYETGGYHDVNPYLTEEKRTVALPKGTQPGFIIPEFLKERWHLILGSTSEKLRPMLQELGSVDLFLHDSLHTVENMSFEFNLAYQYIKQNGFLASDNIDWNNIFEDFSINKSSYSYLAYYESPLLKDNFGLIIKS